ncbi:MAG: hypothetical protein HRU15_18705, partial [Planctomycetes bacterium]|nr:hypothetical protein [Planctomycetota bacterium]
MSRFIPIILCLIACFQLTAEEKLFEYKLKDGRTIIGQASEAFDDGPINIKLWFKTRFMGKMKIEKSDIVSTKPYSQDGASLLTGKTKKEEEEEVPQIFLILLKDEREIKGTPSEPIDGVIKVKTWFKGRFMGVISLKQSEIRKMTKIALEDVEQKDEAKSEEELAELANMSEKMRERKI